MSRLRPTATVAALLLATGLVAPAGWWTDGAAAALALIALAAVVTGLVWRGSTVTDHGLAALAVLAGAVAPLLLLRGEGPFGAEAPGLWIYVAGWLLFLWSRLDALAHLPDSTTARVLAPVLFGLALLYLWQVLTIGFGVPQVLLPSPAQVGTALTKRFDVLWLDFQQTFFKSVLSGYVIGCGAGLVVAVIADRFGFLARGLLPVCTLAGAVPIVGIAPIMVMWFGFDWQSKAAVVVVVTFFPMLVNALAGLRSADAMQRDLMHSYAAGHWQTLLKLRLPTALPFIFNALKINSTLAMISAIVAEFFGSPILGLGFRISAEVARLNVDVVWGAIAIAAVAGSLFYGVIAAVERMLTFWHPSYRT
ncbi:MAG: ABC transporter permease [Burkholderiales bacterium]|nr:ABC transporter permease [Burkholderiales bacterium]